MSLPTPGRPHYRSISDNWRDEEVARLWWPVPCCARGWFAIRFANSAKTPKRRDASLVPWKVANPGVSFSPMGVASATYANPGGKYTCGGYGRKTRISVESTATPVGQVRLIEPCRTCNRLDALMAASVAGLAVFPTPASSQLNVITHGFSLDEAALVEAGSRRGRIHATPPRSHETFATRPYHYRPNYRYFGADPDRYFGIGPGSYECFGFDCNW